MSVLKLEYEILISGIYPFEGAFEKQGFTITKNTIDDKLIDLLTKESVIYLSPLMGMCCYPNSVGVPEYLTFRKDELIEIEYGDNKDYDIAVTNHYLESLNLFEIVDTLEKAMVLEINNDIKFPIKMVKAYDANGKFITLLANFMKLNIPSLLSADQTKANEVIKRQNNRLSTTIEYAKVIELASNNNHFKNALSMYQAAFSVSDHNVGFTLLVIAMESLLGLATYVKPETCESCGQKKYLITATISENVSLLLMDKDEVIKKRIRQLYSVRSKFVHSGIEVMKNDEQELQEYVRKVLLMYWFVSMYIKSFDHQSIIAEIQSIKYKDNLMYKNYLTGLDNTTFEEKRTKMLSDTLVQIFGKA